MDAAGGALGNAYQAAAPIASQVSGTLAAQLPKFADMAFTPSAGITAATGYNTDVLGGKYLGAGNPYLEAQIAATNQDVGNSVNSTFGAAGRTGSGANQFALGKALSQNETGLRYADYGAERDRMGSAAALAPSLDNARFDGLGAYLTAGQAAVGMPQQAASAYASDVGALFGKYQTGTTTTNPSLGAIMAQIAANAANNIKFGG